MTQSDDRPFDWVAAFAVISGAAVMVPSLLTLAATLLGNITKLHFRDRQAATPQTSRLKLALTILSD